VQNGRNFTTEAILNELKARIRQELLLNRTLLSQQRRSKESVPDPRPSSTAMGAVAAAVLGCVLVGVLLTDAGTMLGHVCGRVAKRKRRVGIEPAPRQDRKRRKRQLF
jgi:hypothetical protein